MLDKNTLDELKKKLPHRYTQKVIDAYNVRFKSTISRHTIGRFFDGKTYSQEIHEAVLDVASVQQNLNQKTKETIAAL